MNKVKEDNNIPFLLRIYYEYLVIFLKKNLNILLKYNLYNYFIEFKKNFKTSN